VAALWGECHALPDTERQHRAVSPHLLQKTEPFNDFVVKLDQFRSVSLSMSMFTTSSNWLRRIRRQIDFHDANAAAQPRLEAGAT